MTIRPLTGQCLLEILPEDKMSPGGLHLPDPPARNRIEVDIARMTGERRGAVQARVLQIGPWRPHKNGRVSLPEIQPGQRVIIGPNTGTKLSRNISEKYRLVDTRLVLALVEKGGDEHDAG